jgi:hypothetical protein
MRMGAKTISKKQKPRSIRQSVTIPAPLAVQVRRVAKERRLTVTRALIELAERGVRAESEVKKDLKSSYDRFMSEPDPTRKNERGKDLVRTIFGPNAIAEDPVL